MMKDKLLVISDNKSYSPWDPIEKEDEMNRVFIFGKVIGACPRRTGNMDNQYCANVYG